MQRLLNGEKGKRRRSAAGMHYDGNIAGVINRLSFPTRSSPSKPINCRAQSRSPGHA